MTSLLEIKNVSRSFGGIHAVQNVSLNLEQGQIIGLIGPNGAGKSTLVNVITGVHPPQQGEILFKGQHIEGLKPYQVAAKGIARTFQVVQPFPEMTVLENVMAGALFAARKSNLLQAREAAMAQLEFTGLASYAHRPASELTLAFRKKLELAKSLAMEPKLLLLDEVNAGLNSAEVNQALELIKDIAKQGVTIVIIEHLLKVVFTLCDQIAVLHQGQLIAHGTPKKIVEDPQVISAYLGARFAEKYGAAHE